MSVRYFARISWDASCIPSHLRMERVRTHLAPRPGGAIRCRVHEAPRPSASRLARLPFYILRGDESRKSAQYICVTMLDAVPTGVDGGVGETDGVEREVQKDRVGNCR
ncbi:hypothetical protein SCP_0108290 [Sparassis crispa]|uniref:Uncharacterized protein n=1 Tax=Sparassis crispa TaxID=139825 RepID=A0A401G720_9APHY|nr:hypothetical protein SCP_0108290 [Sparassis crispa]GBE77947.1 hypothetical protein SCP_0108290 [Sparassis crispa]